MKQKIQIIGKVSGLNLIDVQTKFKLAQNHLEHLGYEVINPMHIVPLGSTWSEAMRICLRSLHDVDAVAVLPDWTDSRGSHVEYMAASALNLTMLRI
ncbi:MAG: DUF4406 domain-containing protein [Bacteroidota bacterium]